MAPYRGACAERSGSMSSRRFIVAIFFASALVVGMVQGAEQPSMTTFGEAVQSIADGTLRSKQTFVRLTSIGTNVAFFTRIRPEEVEEAAKDLSLIQTIETADPMVVREVALELAKTHFEACDLKAEDLDVRYRVEIFVEGERTLVFFSDRLGNLLWNGAVFRPIKKTWLVDIWRLATDAETFAPR